MPAGSLHSIDAPLPLRVTVRVLPVSGGAPSCVPPHTPAVQTSGPVQGLPSSHEPGSVTVIDAAAELLAALGSDASLETDAAVPISVPFPAHQLTLTPIVKTAGAPEASVAAVQLIVPVPPIAGFEQLHPAGDASDRNVVPDGTAPVSTGLAAAPGPLFVTMSV